MKLNLDQIRSVTSGAVHITEERDGIHFFRFTKAQMDLQHPYVPDLDRRYRTTAGIRLSFRTDSRTLFLCADMTVCSEREYYALDVVVDGELIGSMDNFSHLELPEDYTQLSYKCGVHEASFDLGEGEKDVHIHLPWNACTVLRELGLEDGASLTSLVQGKKLLAFGDSITQGYDVQHPSNHHIAKLGLALGASVHNKGLGGSVSFPELVQERDCFDPDYILVAYGTNDWRKIALDDFLDRYRALLEAIRNHYPAAQVFLLTPIWRKDSDVIYAAGPFFEVEQHIKAIASDFRGFHVISGIDLVPHKEQYYADLRLHPNDRGSEQYFGHLWTQIEPMLRL